LQSSGESDIFCHFERQSAIQNCSQQPSTWCLVDEAAARHVLVERTGSYPQGGHKGSFPVTLANAFTTLVMAVGPSVKLDDDPHRALQQCLFLLGTAVNRLRNEAGTGHGKPGPPTKTTPLAPAEARLVARATALLVGAMLDVLWSHPPFYRTSQSQGGAATVLRTSTRSAWPAASSPCTELTNWSPPWPRHS
jgi:hypothetical protein